MLVISGEIEVKFDYIYRTKRTDQLTLKQGKFWMTWKSGKQDCSQRCWLRGRRPGTAGEARHRREDVSVPARQGDLSTRLRAEAEPHTLPEEVLSFLCRKPVMTVRVNVVTVTRQFTGGNDHEPESEF